VSRRPALAGRHVVVVGAGLAGLASALRCADDGARVTVLERQRRLGGMTWSFEHNGLTMDNGQHVFLRCCTEYIDFLRRLGATDVDARIAGPLDIPVVAAPASPSGAPRVGRIRRTSLPAPMHLLGSLVRYPHIARRDRLSLGRAVIALRRIDLDDPSLDDRSFGEWLASHGQSPGAIQGLWDLITVPTVNLRADEASLAMGAMVFQTGLLRRRDAADIGWSRVPLGVLHGERGARALERAGASVHTSARVKAVVDNAESGGYRVITDDGSIGCDAVVLALPHTEAAAVMPAGAVAGQDRWEQLGSSSVVDVHIVYDRPVTRWELMAAHSSPVQWVFDRSAAAGIGGPGDRRQYLAVSVSAADGLLATRPEDLVAGMATELPRLLPAARGARVVDSFVTKERHATFRAAKGSGRMRPAARTRYPGLVVAGAWTDTGWPATMEGAVRSGRQAARELVADLARTAPHGAPARTPHDTQEVA
jgi:squalene-associated FAD-dependent desaturase